MKSSWPEDDWIPEPSDKRWHARCPAFSLGEELAPRQGGGSAPKLTDADREVLRETVAEQAEVTLAECQALLAAQGRGPVSIPTICRALQQLQLLRKKKSRGQ